MPAYVTSDGCAGSVMARELTERIVSAPLSGGGVTTEVSRMAEETTSKRTASRARGGEAGGTSSRNRAQENGSHPGGGKTKRGEQRSQAEKPGGKAGKGNRGQGQQQAQQARQGSPLARGVRGVKTAGTAAVDAVKQNPVPAALIGAGLAWLIAQSAAERYPQVGNVGSTVAKGAKNAASTVGEGVSTATGAVKEVLSTTAGTVKEGASTVGEYTMSGLSTVGGAIGSGASTVGSAIGSGASAVGRGTVKGLTATKDAVVNSWQNHPVITSAAALAAGIALAMMVPSTGPERKAMGKRSAATTGRAKSAAKEFL